MQPNNLPPEGHRTAYAAIFSPTAVQARVADYKTAQAPPGDLTLVVNKLCYRLQCNMCKGM